MPRVVLVHPPVWSAFAPYLAMPILCGALRERQHDVEGVDLNILFLDWILSPRQLSQLCVRINERLLKTSQDEYDLRRALAVAPAAIANIDAVKQLYRSDTILTDIEAQRFAEHTLRDASWIISAAFEGLTFDVYGDNVRYAESSTRLLLTAATDENSLYGWSFREIWLPRLADASISVIGLSVTAEAQVLPALTVAALAKKHRPDITIVMGGNYATRLVEKWPPSKPHSFFGLIDFFIAFEGEESLPMFCDNILFGESHDVPGLVYVADGVVKKNPARTVDINKTPPPDFSDVPLNKYFTPTPILPIQSSRGCAWSCAFCSIPYASGKFRFKKPKLVADELDRNALLYNAKHFIFVDEIMTLRSLKESSRELIERKRNYKWYAETRFSPGWNASITESLYSAGCRHLDFGLESFSQRMLDLMRKETDVSYIPANIDACLASGIAVHLLVMFGFPSESEEEAQLTRSFVAHVMERSNNVFGNPYSSWGSSQFVVEDFSPVADDPGKFNIRLLPKDESADLSTARHHVDLNLHSARGSSTIESEPTDTGKKSVWNRFHFRVRKHDEELNFLKACFRYESPKRPNRSACVWNIEKCADIRLRVGTSLSITPDRLTECSLASGRRALFYRPISGAVLEIPVPQTIPLGQADLDKVSLTLIEKVELLNYGFVESIDLTASQQIEGFSFGQPFGKFKLSKYSKLQEVDSLCFLNNFVTGQSVKLDNNARAVLEGAAELGGINKLDFLKLIDGFSNEYVQGLLNILDELISCCFCYLISNEDEVVARENA